MATITLNIGSAINGKDNALPISTVVSSLAALNLAPFQFRTAVSETETTYVLCVVDPEDRTLTEIASAVYNLCEVLSQEAIAYADDYQDHITGWLVGPKAEAWGGKFNPDFFISW